MQFYGYVVNYGKAGREEPRIYLFTQSAKRRGCLCQSMYKDSSAGHLSQVLLLYPKKD